MNIFKILANGGGNISETNVSAFLGYILDSSADHGLGDRFLEKFLNAIDEDNSKIAESKVFYEQKLKHENKDKKITDLVIVGYSIQGTTQKQSMLLDFVSSKKRISSIIPIEVKINNGSYTKGQLSQQYNQLLNSLTSEVGSQKKINTSTIAYVPHHKKFLTESEETNKSINGKCKHIFWDIVDERDSIVGMLDEIFKEESIGNENPLNQYTLTTLKAFKSFIQNEFTSQKQEEKDGTRKLYSSLTDLLANHPSLINSTSKKTIKKFCDHIANGNNSELSFRHSPGHPLSIFFGNKKIFGFKRYGSTIRPQLLFGPYKSYQSKMSEYTTILLQRDIKYKHHTEKVLLLSGSNKVGVLLQIFDEMILSLTEEMNSKT